MRIPRLAVVTASLNLEKTVDWWGTWRLRAEAMKNENWPVFDSVIVTPKGKAGESQAKDGHWSATVVTGGVVGTVPAFAAGVRKAKQMGAEIIACFHDDLRIDEEGWDRQVAEFFATHPKAGLAGFFGAKSLGAGDIYQTPYRPVQMARGGCGSNLGDAELHGERWTAPRKVICHDGFSLIGRARFMETAWNEVENLGVKHHIYDVLIGALAAEAGWESWFLPIRCKHAGGMTAVGSEEYQAWARTMQEKGDQGIWEEAHALGYARCRGILPLWIEDEFPEDSDSGEVEL